MLVVFSPIFVVNARLIFGYNYRVPINRVSFSSGGSIKSLELRSPLLQSFSNYYIGI